MDNQKTLMSSNKMDWGTPWELFRKINNVFNFNLDACADLDNHKHTFYITEEMNALNIDWMNYHDANHGTVRAWVNPPYGRALTTWLDKIEKEAQAGSVVVVLVPARTETKWFQVMWDHADHILFFNKRITFEGADSGAPFPSALGIFNRGLSKSEKKELSKLGKVVDL